jgi:hypothetical protein
VSEKRQHKVSEVDAVAAKAQADARVEAEKQRAADLKVLDQQIKGMSYNQLRGKLRNEIHRKLKDEFILTGLNAAYAIASLVILENTQTKENPFAKLSSALR